VIAAALLVALASSSPDVERFVIAIGVNTGGGERATLRFADDDAARFYLQTHKGASRAWLLTTFDDESVRLYPTLTEMSAPPTGRELARALGEAMWLVRQASASGKKTELVFYFAGHGDVSSSGEGFLVLDDGALTKSELARQVVEASPADVNHVLLDACASFHMVARGDETAEGVVPLSPAHLTLLDAERAKADAAWRRTGVLVSTSDDASVHESPALGGGVFSFLLRSALAGAADVNGDGRVEYVEAAAFVASATARLEDPRARVDVYARAPEVRPHAALFDLATSGADAFLVVDDPGARVRLIDSRGLPFAEFHTDRAGVVLALSGEPFFVVQRGDDEAVLVPRRAGAYALSSLDFSRAPAARGRALGAHQGLFDLAYGDAFVDGFVAEGGHAPPLASSTFRVAWAEDGAPPLEIPWGLIAGAAYTGALVLAVGTVTSTIGNALSLAALEARYQATGTVDARMAIATDAWLALAATTGAMAMLSTVIGTAAFALMVLEERE